MIKTFSLFARDDETDKIQVTFDDNKIYVVNKSGCQVLNIHLKETDIDSDAWRIHFSENEFFGTYVSKKTIRIAQAATGIKIGGNIYILPMINKRLQFAKICKLIYLDLWHKLNNI